MYDGCSDFGRSIIHHLQCRTALLNRQTMILFQAFIYVLDIDDGIIDKRTDGNTHTTKSHGIDIHAQQMQHYDRSQKRQRYSHKGNNRRTETCEEKEQHQYHTDGTLDE